MGWFRTMFAGSVIGTAVGLLLAPEKGEKTREKLQKAIKTGREKFEEIKSQLNSK